MSFLAAQQNNICCLVHTSHNRNDRDQNEGLDFDSGRMCEREAVREERHREQCG